MYNMQEFTARIRSLWWAFIRPASAAAQRSQLQALLKTQPFQLQCAAPELRNGKKVSVTTQYKAHFLAGARSGGSFPPPLQGLQEPQIISAATAARSGYACSCVNLFTLCIIIQTRGETASSRGRGICSRVSDIPGQKCGL